MARVVTIQVKPEEMEACISIFREVKAPSIAVRPGFDHGHWWVDREAGKATSVTFWATAAHERRSRPNITRLVDAMARVLSSPLVEQRTYERVHDEFARDALEGPRQPSWSASRSGPQEPRPG